jgi:hypothetical protein
MPGPYLVSADLRSIEPEGMTAAEWMQACIGPGHQITSDRVNTLLIATYGNVWPVTAVTAKTSAASVFTSLQLGPDEDAILQQDRVQYLVVDRRLSTGLPRVSTYFDQPASGEQQDTRPIDPAALAKFDGVKNVSRIFDSGNIIIYDVEAIIGGRSITSTPSRCVRATDISG